MAWKDTAVPLLRNAIDDPSVSRYSNDRLGDVLISTAYFIVKEFEFDTTYTVSVPNETISPDPESDGDFITLLVLKTKVSIYSGEHAEAARNAMSVKDGPSSVDTTASAKAIKDALEKAQSEYDQAKAQFTLGNSRGVQAILSPYTSDYVWRGSNLK